MQHTDIEKALAAQKAATRGELVESILSVIEGEKRMTRDMDSTRHNRFLSYLATRIQAL